MTIITYLQYEAVSRESEPDPEFCAEADEYWRAARELAQGEKTEAIRLLTKERDFLPSLLDGHIKLTLSERNYLEKSIQETQSDLNSWITFLSK